jgi:Skp family chaperone for outer membrane proteins
MHHRPLIASGAAIAFVLQSAMAFAAPAPAAATPPALHQGPSIPGFCVYSQGVILGNSKVGQAFQSRMNVLGQQVKAELQPQADSLQTEEKSLQAQAASLDQAALQARRANLQLRLENFQRTNQLRQQELEATARKQIAVIGRELNPILQALYQARNCSVLVNADGGTVAAVSPAMDLSSAATVELDGRVQTLTFDREHLDTQPASTAVR